MDRRKSLLRATALIIVIGISIVIYVGMSSFYPSGAIESKRILKVNIESMIHYLIAMKMMENIDF